MARQRNSLQTFSKGVSACFFSSGCGRDRIFAFLTPFEKMRFFVVPYDGLETVDEDWVVGTSM